MKKIIILAISLLWAFHVQAQRFRPYSAFGPEVNIAWSVLPAYKQMGQRFQEPGYGPYLANAAFPVFDLKFHYDYAPLKWLGLGTGAGLTVRGGKGHSSTGFQYSQQHTTKKIYYLNVPFRLQLKAGFFWLEPGLQTNILLGMSEKNGDVITMNPADLEKDDLNTFYLAWTLKGRFNIFRGLSLSLGRERWITPVGHVESDQQDGLSTTYYQMGWVVGVRYMFNQPYK